MKLNSYLADTQESPTHLVLTHKYTFVHKYNVGRLRTMRMDCNISSQHNNFKKSSTDNWRFCLSLSSLRHECAQAVCGQRAQPMWNRPHRASGSPLPQDRGELGQATRHRLVSFWITCGVLCPAALEAALWCGCEWMISTPLKQIHIHILDWC